MSDVVMAPIHPAVVPLEELRVAKFFGTSERFWLNLQGRYEIELQRDRLGRVLEGIRPLKSA